MKTVDVASERFLSGRIREAEERVSGEDAVIYARLCERRRIWTDIPFARLALSMGVRAGRVLDLGCGPGHVAVALARRARGMEVWALDISREMLQHVQANSARAGVVERVKPTEGDMRCMPLPDGHFDLVVSQYAFHHLPNAGAAMGEINRVIKPGGAVLIRDFLRPKSALVMDMLMVMARFVLGVDREGREQYRESLQAGFSMEDVWALANCADAPEGLSVRRRFPSEFVVWRRAVNQGNR